MIWLQLIIMNFILIFLINTIFCFNRTVYVLLSSLVIFLFTSFIFIFFEFEFLGLMFATVYVGGIAVMFLFLILTVDVRVENNEKVFLKSSVSFWKIIFPVIFSVFFSFTFLWFCDPMMFASMDFYLFCNKKILFSWSFSNEPVYLVHQGENLFSHRLFGFTDFSSLVYSEQDVEFRWIKADCDYTPFSLEFFLDCFVYNDYIDDTYTLGVFFFFFITLRCWY